MSQVQKSMKLDRIYTIRYTSALDDLRGSPSHDLFSAKYKMVPKWNLCQIDYLSFKPQSREYATSQELSSYRIGNRCYHLVFQLTTD